MSDIYDYLDKNLYTITGVTTNPDGTKSATVQNTGGTGSEIPSEQIVTGELDGNLSFTGGFIQSFNFVTGVSGWRLSANGTLEAVNGIFVGTIVATDFSFKDSGGTTVMQGGASGGASGYVLELTTTTNVNNGMKINLTQSASNAILITSSVSGNGFYLSNTANVTNRGIFIEQTNSGANNTLPCIEAHHGGAYYAYYGQGTNASGGMILDITGTGDAIHILNAGTGNSIDISDSSSTGSASAIVLTYGRAGAAIDISVSHSGGNPTAIKIATANGSGNSYAFEFAGSEVVSSAVGGTQNRKIRVLLPTGAVYYIPCYDA